MAIERGRREAGAAPRPVDPGRIEEVAGKVLGDLAATMATIACGIGQRLGLFRALAEGPARSDEVATATGLQERYVREWASGLTAAGYLVHHPEDGRFSLSPEHAAVLADERHPAFLGAAHEVVRELFGVLDPLEQAFRRGGGVTLASYGDEFWSAVRRLTGVSFEHLLVPNWIPAIAGLEERLNAGARLADVGCGGGVALIELAKAFPRSTFNGFDIHGPNIEHAAQAARAAGIADRVTFERRDATEALPGRYDAVTLFDVAHDCSDPVRLLREVRSALTSDGVLVILEARCGERLEDNQGPVGTLLYGLSLLHCLPQSLAAGGAGLGTCGLPESKLRKLCVEAGFTSLESVAEEPLDVLYAARR